MVQRKVDGHSFYLVKVEILNKNYGCNSWEDLWILTRVYYLCKKGQATKGDYKDVVRLFREKIRRATARDCQGVLLTHVEPTANQHTQILFYRVALQPLISQSILMPGITPPQVQDLALVLITFHAVADGLMLQSL